MAPASPSQAGDGIWREVVIAGWAAAVVGAAWGADLSTSAAVEGHQVMGVMEVMALVGLHQEWAGVCT